MEAITGGLSEKALVDRAAVGATPASRRVRLSNLTRSALLRLLDGHPDYSDRLCSALGGGALLRLRAVARSSIEYLSGTLNEAEAGAQLKRAQPTAVARAGRVGSAAEQTSEGGCPQGPAAAQPHGHGCLALLQDIWHYSMLADSLTYAMGAATVQQFRVISRAGRECMRSAHAGLLVPARCKAWGAEAGGQQLGAGSGCLALLQEIWQYSMLADALTCSMGASTVRQFRVASRAGRECMRSALAWAPAQEPTVAPGEGGKVPPLRLARRCVTRERRRPQVAEVESPAAVAAIGSAPVVTAMRLANAGMVGAVDHHGDGELARLAELCARHGSDNAAETCTHMSAGDQAHRSDTQMCFGDYVKLSGLQKKQKLNGMQGKVVGYCNTSKRWQVVLPTGLLLRVRAEHVEQVPGPARPEDMPCAFQQLPVLRALGHRASGLLLDPAQAQPSLVSPAAAHKRDFKPARPWFEGLLFKIPGTVKRMAALAGPNAACNLEATSEAVFNALQGVGKLYVTGGCDCYDVSNSAECFDLTTCGWQELPPMHRPRQTATSIIAGRRWFVIGGTDASDQADDSVESFNPSTRAWTVLPRMSRPRAQATVCALAGCIYVCGGHSSNRVALKSMERFDLTMRSWSMMPSMAQPRYSAMAGVIGGCLYICGGMDENELDSLERFDPQQMSWRTLAPMSLRRCYAASAVLGQCLYIAGGCQGHVVHGSGECFNVAAGAWEPLPPMLQPRYSAAVATRGNRHIFLCGGSSIDGRRGLQEKVATSSCESLDIYAGFWQWLPPMPHKRCFSISAIAAGHLYVFGGVDLGSVDRTRIVAGSGILRRSHDAGTGGSERMPQPMRIAERLNLQTWVWEELPPMMWPRIVAAGSTRSL